MMFANLGQLWNAGSTNKLSLICLDKMTEIKLCKPEIANINPWPKGTLDDLEDSGNSEL